MEWDGRVEQIPSEGAREEVREILIRGTDPNNSRKAGRKWNYETADELLDEFDADGDGMLSIDEVCAPHVHRLRTPTPRCHPNAP